MMMIVRNHWRPFMVGVFAAALSFATVGGAGATETTTTTVATSTTLAPPMNPLTETTGFLGEGVSEVAPILVAVFGGALVLLALNVGLRMAWKAVRAKGASAG